ncbi:THAP domain-containing protein 6 isoform X2 [Camponotus floridanus]|uniref:THAP domain-containing protein 6 isoform X2 n=1 Tax=Camponotus floridanus TaxID=104421 RepID=UPI000DC6AE99|nr:THAP domain-containing protein 6 isoform X2 [Camponotus floridanus]
MPLCVAIGCYNKSYRKAKGQKNVEQDVEITFHRFPKDEARKLTRIKNMGLRDECLPKSPHLCSLHFSESSFDRSFLMRPRLKENAIPILNISEIESTEKEIEIPSVSNTSIKTSLTVNNNDLTFKSEITKQQTSKRYREDDNYSDNEIMSKRYSIGQRLEDSPRKKLLRKALSYQKEHFQRQIRTWKQRNKRQEKQIATLNAILKDLKQKSLLADEHADILETIDLAIWARAAAPDGVRRIARTIARTTRQLEDVFKRPTKRWTVGEACGRRGQGINDVLGSSITISDCSRIEDIIIRHNDLRHYTKTNKKHNNI